MSKWVQNLQVLKAKRQTLQTSEANRKTLAFTAEETNFANLRTNPVYLWLDINTAITKMVFRLLIVSWLINIPDASYDLPKGSCVKQRLLSVHPV